MGKNQLDLSKPAFGVESQKVADITAVEPKLDETPKLVEKEVDKTEGVSDEKPRVPYSRFEKFHKSSIQFEAEAKFWKDEAERLSHQPQSTVSNEIPDYWVEMYGDTDASKKAWSIESKRQNDFIATAERKAIEAVERRSDEVKSREKENEAMIDESLAEVSDIAGRDLTEQEQSTILDIMDEYTPKDADGNYLGGLIAPDKAWEIYELKQQASKSSRNQSRDQVASLTNSTPALSSDQAEQDKNWNPLNWSSWRDKLPK